MESETVPSQAPQAVMIKIEGVITSNNEMASEDTFDSENVEGRSWDSDESDDEPVVIGTEHPADAPWFNVEPAGVVRERAMEAALDHVESEMDLDVPLLFRPFYTKIFDKINQRLGTRVTEEILLIDIPGSVALRDMLGSNGSAVVFPVKKEAYGSRESDSPSW